MVYSLKFDMNSALSPNIDSKRAHKFSMKYVEVCFQM